MPPFASNSPPLTIQALLKNPILIARPLTSLVAKRLVADRLFIHGSPDQVAGGAMRYQELEGIYLDDDAVEIAEGADFPLSKWAETVKTAPVRQFGDGFPVTNLAVRRNQRDVITRGTVKLANTIAKKIDGVAMGVLTDTATYPAIQTSAASAHWATITTDIISDIAAAETKLETKDNGYSGFQGATLVLHTNKRDALMNNTALRAALPREAFNQPGQIQTGMIAPFLGLKEILFTPQLDTTKALLLDTGIAGTIADEEPDAREGWVSDQPEGQNAPVYVKVEEYGKPAVHFAVYGGRWPAIALTQPDAVVVITGIA
jgi:hypothetical protein